MSYSTDLRKKVIEFIEQGKGITETAEMFGISRYVIYKWLKMKKVNGSLVDRPPKRSWKKTDPNLLTALVKKHPDYTLAEYASHFKTSTVAICRALKRLKITRKKRLNSTESGMKRNALYFWSK